MRYGLNHAFANGQPRALDCAVGHNGGRSGCRQPSSRENLE